MGRKQLGVPAQRHGRAGAPRPWRRSFPALALLLVSLGLLAPAGAGATVSGSRFVYELCDSALPGGASPALEFAVNPGVPIGYFNTCAQPGGAIGITESGHASATFAFLTVEVPATPGGFVETETISAAAGGLGPGNNHTFVYEQPWPQNNAGESTRTFFIRREPGFLGSSGNFWLLMNCDGNYGPGCEAGPTIWAHYIAATEVDMKPPTLTGLRGGLLAGGTIRGHQSLEVEAQDVGGGLSNIFVFVNDKAVARAPSSCALANVKNRSYSGPVALSTTPCLTKLKGSWVIDTEETPFRLGANTVTVCASDFATIGSPNTTCLPLQTVEVDNSCAPSAAGGGELLSAQFSRSNRETQVVGFGKDAEVIGQLHTNAGDPVANATLCVKARTIGTGAPLKNAGTTQTDANGNYAFGVPAGPNRQIVVGYRDDTLQVARDVRYYAHVRPRLRASPRKLRNGKRVRFKGYLPGPSHSGRVVVFQANVAGSKRWITFRRATSGERGFFRASYHFRSTTRTTRYRFRAVIPLQDGYPWMQGHSRPVRVVVKR